MKRLMILTIFFLFVFSSMAFAAGILVKNSLPGSGSNSHHVDMSVDVPFARDPHVELSPGNAGTLSFNCKDGKEYVVKCKVIIPMAHDVHIAMDGCRCGDKVRVIYDNAYMLEKFFD